MRRWRYLLVHGGVSNDVLLLLPAHRLCVRMRNLVRNSFWMCTIQRLIMERPKNWSDLWLSKSEIGDVGVIGIDNFIFWKLHSDLSIIVATIAPQTCRRQGHLTWPRCMGDKVFRKCAERMSDMACKNDGAAPRRFRYHQKTWGGAQQPLSHHIR